MVLGKSRLAKDPAVETDEVGGFSFRSHVVANVDWGFMLF
jgi:hypothetical protein